ncbi:hypothetical protein EVAR_86242_1 [Eumeta japonica]|uniref:Uncharacterized protein n=1 Tax=Eumeta variegata TaxID=151549 RepID=A0A4C1UBN2_EUMVA|nr:hypothetical protein EVAR_86242_1 [Eumeta japonica]
MKVRRLKQIRSEGVTEGAVQAVRERSGELRRGNLIAQQNLAVSNCFCHSDEFHDGRPSTAVNNKYIDPVRHMIEREQQFSSPEKAVEEYKKPVSEITRKE